MSMLAPFNSEARHLIQFSRELYRQGAVTADSALLEALLSSGHPAVCSMLQTMGVTLDGQARELLLQRLRQRGTNGLNLRRVLDAAIKRSSKIGHSAVTADDLLFGLLNQRSVRIILEDAGIDVTRVRQTLKVNGPTRYENSAEAK